MCGIVGYIGKKNCLPILIKGLKKLEYRGYDSAGIAYIKNNKIKVTKTTGRIINLENKIIKNDQSTIGIGHTRWATHGEVNTKNSHPHQVGNITIVHNGILENYQELKNILIKKGYKFKSEIDTEVLCAYIDYEYQKSDSKDMLIILNDCMKIFKGSYAVAIIVNNIKDKLFVIKKDSPLIIGIGDKENYIASDIGAYGNTVLGYIPLNNMEIGIISENNISIYKGGIKQAYEIKHTDYDFNESDKEEYDHYMLKEIHEQSSIIKKLNKKYLNNLKQIPDISKYKKIHIIGCGTAYNAGHIGKHIIEEYNNIEIQNYIASEYRYQKNFIDKNTLVIAISQSGETADTLACINKAKKEGCHTLSIVNVKDSSIARATDEVIYTEAGQEIAVASTKAYTTQVYILSLLALKIAIKNNSINIEKTIKEYNKLPKLINKIMDKEYEKIADNLYQENNIFYLGRNIDHTSVEEGSLKLKEISYIHSEAYQAGELKHGTISLIEKNTKVISLITKKEIADKTISNIKEVKARGAHVILLIKEKTLKNIDKSCYDEIIEIPNTITLLQPILNVIPLQLIAYYTAKKKGCDIDKPRNLAKSVTVE